MSAPSVRKLLTKKAPRETENKGNGRARAPSAGGPLLRLRLSRRRPTLQTMPGPAEQQGEDKEEHAHHGQAASGKCIQVIWWNFYQARSGPLGSLAVRGERARPRVINKKASRETESAPEATENMRIMMSSR